MILGYGWLLYLIKNKVIFYSGLDLIVDSGILVFLVGEGIVVFVGK